jgi:enoyl-CoA hydratase
LTEGFRSERRDDVLVMTIDRPWVRNALDLRSSRAIAVAVDELDRDAGLRVGVLTGAGGDFSTGMDLGAFLQGESPDLPGRGMGGITTTPPRKPLIAAVEGWALAGGFEMVLACDLVVAADTARFGLPEVKRALVAAGGGTTRLPRRVPAAVALEMLLTGDPIDARRAAELGLVNRLTAAGNALEGAVELARRLCENGPLALAATKEIARRSVELGEAAALARQAEMMDVILASEDAREGARAFAEKRPPVWRGR